MKQRLIWLAISGLCFAGLCLAVPAPAAGQQIFVETPSTNVSDSFFENFGVNFGFSLPAGQGSGSRVVGLDPLGRPLGNVTFSQGGAASAIPPFGGFDPSAGAQTGFAVQGRNGGGFSLGLNFGTGSTRTLQSTTPGITVQNGFGGSLFNGSSRPFVTGVVPVVGNRDVIDNGVTRALNSGRLNLGNLGGEDSYRQSSYVAPESNHNPRSTAETSMASVESITAARKAKQLAKTNALNSLIKKSFTAEEESDFKSARSYVRKAIKKCDDPVKKKLLRKRLTTLTGK